MGIPEDIVLFEQSLNELIIKYEQYFLGLEKREPLQLLGQVESLGRKYQGFQIINTMMKFKYNSGISSFQQLQAVLDADHPPDRRGEIFPRPVQDGDAPEGQAPRSSPQGRPLRTTEAASTRKSRVCIRTYLEARQACGLPVDNITREMIAAGIEKHKPAIMNKYKCKGVDFKVVIEDGMPKIKARPRK